MKRSLIAFLVLASFGASAHGHNHGGNMGGHSFNGHSFNGGHFGHGRHMGNSHSFTGFSRGSINMTDGTKSFTGKNGGTASITVSGAGTSTASISTTVNAPNFTASSWAGGLGNGQVEAQRSIQTAHYTKNVSVLTDNMGGISRNVSINISSATNISRPFVAINRDAYYSPVAGSYISFDKHVALPNADYNHDIVYSTQQADRTLSFDRSLEHDTGSYVNAFSVSHVADLDAHTFTVTRGFHDSNRSTYKQHPYAILTSVYSKDGVIRSLDTNIHITPQPAPTPAAPAKTYDDSKGDTISFWWM
ncbi:TPA: hypothetical protein ACW722_000595 [Enterobacter hormaechei subsp. xiangfangensis]